MCCGSTLFGLSSQGFFRRSIQQKIQYRPCTKNQQCSILRINRNRCQYCRLKKCIAVGMSRDAVRFGRVPKREIDSHPGRHAADSCSKSQEKALAELEDDQRLANTVVRAHLETCDFTRAKVEPMLAMAREMPSYTTTPQTLACPLNPNPQPLIGHQELPQNFSKRFSPAIRGVVEFAKRIPGFGLLAQDDQVTLLKAGVFEVLLVRLACMFDSQTNSMICLNGQVLKREAIHNNSNARFLMDSMFDFAERLNALRLSDAEIGLFCSIVVIAADRPGLRNTELVEKMQIKLKTALQMVVSQSHPENPNICQELIKKIPDLRTLNTLHSEKLLACKMTEQQQQEQQMQQQLYNSVNWEEESNRSPAWSEGGKDDLLGSPRSSSTMDEAVKSPLGSVSSSESVCSGEVAALSEFRPHPTPLLAATLSCPRRRHRDNSHSEGGSTSGDECSSLGDSPNNKPFRFRKLDSPNDSGIESGTEKLEKLSASAPTSVCSSPRSSLEDKVKDIEEEKQHIEDMPVLKRALQAPPLCDTNSLMDEAYKPHKKFRALRKDSAEAEPMVVSNTHPETAYTAQLPQLHHHLTHPNPVQHNKPSSSPSECSSLSSTHSTLAKSLMEGPRMTAEQMKRTDIIHNYIMQEGYSSSVDQIQPSQPLAPSFPSSTSSSTNMPSTSAGYVVLQQSKNVLVCGSNYYIPPQQQQQPPLQQQRPTAAAWPYSAANSVITTSAVQVRPTYVQSVPSQPVQQQQSPQQKMVVAQPTVAFNPPAEVVAPAPPPNNSQLYSRLYFEPPQASQQPMQTTTKSPVPAQPLTCHQQSTPAASPKMVELQVDIADFQPLNLSKKTPPPAPHKIPLEA
uniref:Ecdysone inducible protein E75 n=1 Tax=Thermobia domestica TaxID=89055 RepID=A0A097ZNI4_THEDO|nr:ecdysone inducible protein E75 [Thermobia domestica]